jgi:hypothetical protein
VTISYYMILVQCTIITIIRIIILYSPFLIRNGTNFFAFTDKMNELSTMPICMAAEFSDKNYKTLKKLKLIISLNNIFNILLVEKKYVRYYDEKI